MNIRNIMNIGLDWTGLDWAGLDWTGLDWTGVTYHVSQFIP